MACQFLSADHAAITVTASVGFAGLGLCHAGEADKKRKLAAKALYARCA
jgi:hypothetical protein